MSRKNSLQKFQSITNGDLSQASLTSAVTNIQFLDNIGVQFVWTGDAVGDFGVEVSADHAQDSQGAVTNAGTWTALSFSTSPAAAGSDGNVYIDMNQLSAPWIRTTWTGASGSGTLQCYITGKAV